MNNELQTQNMREIKKINYGLGYVNQDSEEFKSYKIALERHLSELNKDPDPLNIDSTSDGKAKIVIISAIETLLDEFYSGMWSTSNFHWQQIANEIVGSIELTIVHPLTGKEFTRTGAGAITITVDAVPDEIKQDRKQKNAWSLDMQNKKPNALDLAFPKLKTECLKNAAISLGNVFGRNLNRKKTDTFNPIFTNEAEKKELILLAKDIIDSCDNIDELNDAYNSNTDFSKYPEIAKLFENHNNLLYIKDNYAKYKHLIPEQQLSSFDRVIANKETANYPKCVLILKKFEK